MIKNGFGPSSGEFEFEMGIKCTSNLVGNGRLIEFETRHQIEFETEAKLRSKRASVQTSHPPLFSIFAAAAAAAGAPPNRRPKAAEPPTESRRTAEAPAAAAAAAKIVKRKNEKIISY